MEKHQTLEEYIKKHEEDEANKRAHNVCEQESAFNQFIENVMALDIYAERESTDEVFSVKCRLDESPLKYNYASKFPYTIFISFYSDKVVLSQNGAMKECEYTDVLRYFRTYLNTEHPTPVIREKSINDEVIDSLKSIQKAIGGNIRIGN